MVTHIDINFAKQHFALLNISEISIKYHGSHNNIQVGITHKYETVQIRDTFKYIKIHTATLTRATFIYILCPPELDKENTGKSLQQDGKSKRLYVYAIILNLHRC